MAATAIPAVTTERAAERRPASTSHGLVAVLVAFAGLSLGSTIAKSSGSPGAVVALWRFAIGAVLWHAIVAIRGARSGGPRMVTAAAWRLATVPGILFGVNLSCFFSAVERTPVAHAEFINALAPLILVPLGARALHERVQRPVVAWGGVALAGVELILSQAPAGGTSYVGDLLVVGAMLAWVAYLMRAKAARAVLATADFMAVMSTAACITTLAISLVTVDDRHDLVGLSAKGWLLVALLAVTSGMVSHGLIAWAQHRIPVGTISLLQLAQPALGAMWAAVFLGESAAPVQVLGMAIVLTAVGAIARRSARDLSKRA